jgi:ribonuclease P protein component
MQVNHRKRIMTQPHYTLSKQDRLKGEIRVKRLFTEGESFLVYPLRVVYIRDEVHETPLQALFSVPKRRFKRANKRNLLKRRMREAYRLHKKELDGVLTGKELTLSVAFTYIANEPLAFQTIEQKMTEALSILQEKSL